MRHYVKRSRNNGKWKCYIWFDDDRIQVEILVVISDKEKITVQSQTKAKFKSSQMLCSIKHNSLLHDQYRMGKIKVPWAIFSWKWSEKVLYTLRHVYNMYCDHVLY